MNTLYNAFVHQLVGKRIRLADYDISGLITRVQVNGRGHHVVLTLRLSNDRIKEYKVSLVTLFKRTVIYGSFK